MSRSNDRYHGVLLVNKTSGKTSHDVVDDIRRITHQRSVGHTGTLDPLAEGLLVLCVGKATKIARFMSGHRKIYEAVIELGRSTESYDAEGLDTSLPVNPIPEIDRNRWESIFDKFRGEIVQKAPAYSAIQVDGERLYKKARRGEKVTRPERTVTIHSLEFIDYSDTRLHLRIECSAGTYIRSIAHDIGQQLGCGAFLRYLKRVAVDRFSLDQAFQIDELRKMDEKSLNESFLSIDNALNFPEICVTDDFSRQILFGTEPVGTNTTKIPEKLHEGDMATLTDRRGKALAVVKMCGDTNSSLQASSEVIATYIRVLN